MRTIDGAVTWRVHYVSGPAVMSTVTLGPGLHLVGRERRCSLHVDDPAVEPHHAVVEVTDAGCCRLTQLAGRLAVLVDGRPCAGETHDLGDPVAGVLVEVGATRLRFVRGTGGFDGGTAPLQTGEVPGGTGDRMVVRPPRSAPAMVAVSINAPSGTLSPDSSSPGAGALVTGLVGLVVALGMGIWLGQPMLAAFALMGSVVSSGTWVVQRLRSARSTRLRTATAMQQRAAFIEAVDLEGRALTARHLEITPTITDALDAVGTDQLWACRSWHHDAFTVSIGWGNVERAIEIEGTDGPVDPELIARAERAGRLEDVPVPIALDAPEHRVIGLTGDLAPAVIRAILVQLAVRTGPADWRLAAVVGDTDAHAWAERLPHITGPVLDGSDSGSLAAELLRLDDGDPRRLIVVTDRPGLLTTRTSPLRRLLDLDRPITVLVGVGAADLLPAVCTAALRCGPRATARWQPDLGARTDGEAEPWNAVRLRVAGVSRVVAEDVAGQLEHLVDPEDPRVGSERLPTALRLDELDGVVMDRDSVMAAWASAGIDPRPAAVIGRSLDGVIELDLVRDGPHGLVAGTTGSGKSELLRTLVVSLAARVSPDHLSFVLVDYKGGATFDACADLPHTVGVVTDLDDGLAARALVSLEAELHRRERLLRSVGATDLAAYRRVPGVANLPRLVVVIDEFAALAAELPDFLSALVGIAQRGRSLGVHLLLATQRPAGVIDDAVRANTDLRLALRLNDSADAHDVVGVDEPARFPRGVPGRALLRLGPADAVVFQAATCTVGVPSGSGELDDPDGDVRTVLRHAVDAIRDAAEHLAIAEPHRPWLPPLAEIERHGDPISVVGIVSPDDSAVTSPSASGASPIVVGVVDDPAGQRRLPLRWDRAGNLAMIGSLGPGTSTALAAVAAALLHAGDAMVFAIDARGDGSLDVFDHVVGCAGVVGLHDRERIDRTLMRLAADVDHRRVDTSAFPVLVVNGLGALRRALDDVASAESAALLDRVLAEGPAVGVTVAATLEPDGGALAVLPRFSERWIFHLDDPGQGPTFGVPTSRVPPPVSGRLLVASTGLDAQVMTGSTPLAPCDDVPGRDVSGGSVDRIEVLPQRIAPDVLPRPSIDGDGTLHLPVGVCYVDLAPAVLQVPPGEHVLVVGPGRSGRTITLARLLAGWQELHPDGNAWVVAPSSRGRWSDGCGARVVRSVGDLPPMATDRRPTLVVVDDADRVDDVDGRLAILIGDGGPGDLVVAAGRPEALRAAFGHWTGLVRRSRLGFVMAAASELDGDLLGTTLPRRCPIRARPGLAWMIGADSPTLVQVATDESPRSR